MATALASRVSSRTLRRPCSLPRPTSAMGANLPVQPFWGIWPLRLKELTFARVAPKAEKGRTRRFS